MAYTAASVQELFSHVELKATVKELRDMGRFTVKVDLRQSYASLAGFYAEYMNAIAAAAEKVEVPTLQELFTGHVGDTSAACDFMALMMSNVTLMDNLAIAAERLEEKAAKVLNSLWGSRSRQRRIRREIMIGVSRMNDACIEALMSTSIVNGAKRLEHDLNMALIAC